MERKAAASRKRYDELAQARANEKRRHEGSVDRFTLLDGQYSALQHDMEVLTLKMEEEKALQTDAFDIRHSEQRRVLVPIISLTLALILTVTFRGKPLKDYFIRHCRCLLATGSSARSVREQLFLNGAFFLGEEQYTAFWDAMPQLDWFNTQREGMGYESILYSFVTICGVRRRNPGTPYLNQTVTLSLTLTLNLGLTPLLPPNPASHDKGVSQFSSAG